MTIEWAGDSAELRKARGAFFTPPEVTRFLCRWAITSADDAYGGGILKMEPREAARLLIPSVDMVHAHQHQLAQMLPDVKRLLRAGRLSETRTLVDRTVLNARVVAPASLESIRDGHAILSGRRHERARSRTHRQGSK